MIKFQPSNAFLALSTSSKFLSGCTKINIYMKHEKIKQMVSNVLRNFFHKPFCIFALFHLKVYLDALGAPTIILEIVCKLMNFDKF